MSSIFARFASISARRLSDIRARSRDASRATAHSLIGGCAAGELEQTSVRCVQWDELLCQFEHTKQGKNMFGFREHSGVIFESLQPIAVGGLEIPGSFRVCHTGHRITSSSLCSKILEPKCSQGCLREPSEKLQATGAPLHMPALD